MSTSSFVQGDSAHLRRGLAKANLPASRAITRRSCSSGRQAPIFDNVDGFARVAHSHRAYSGATRRLASASSSSRAGIASSYRSVLPPKGGRSHPGTHASFLSAVRQPSRQAGQIAADPSPIRRPGGPRAWRKDYALAAGRLGRDRPGTDHAASPIVTVTRFPNWRRARSIVAALVLCSGFNIRRTSLSATSRSRARRRCEIPAWRQAS